MNRRNLNWRKFTIRLTWILSVIFAIVCYIASYGEVTEFYHPFDFIIYSTLFGVIGFAGTWATLAAAIVIYRIVKRLVKWLITGLKDEE